jgi:hypothetical protein
LGGHHQRLLVGLPSVEGVCTAPNQGACLLGGLTGFCQADGRIGTQAHVLALPGEGVTQHPGTGGALVRFDEEVQAFAVADPYRRGRRLFREREQLGFKGGGGESSLADPRAGRRGNASQFPHPFHKLTRMEVDVYRR